MFNLFKALIINALYINWLILYFTKNQRFTNITCFKQISSNIYITVRAKVLLCLPIIFLFISLLVLLAGTVPPLQPQTIIWKTHLLIGGFRAAILGSPTIIHEKTGTALAFNGIDDVLILPVNPFKSWPQFTIEVLFKPISDGTAAPRFVHFQDTMGNRCTLEIRLTPKGSWYADTFLRNGKTEKELTLIDST